MDYNNHNTKLLHLCLQDLPLWITDKEILLQVSQALKKSINKDSVTAVPATLSLLVAEDLNDSQETLSFLFCACAYFYTAADLLDDIQDKAPNNPVLKQIGSEQAMNIVNLLLMGAYQSLGKTSLPASRQVALMQMFTQMGIQMSVGQFEDIASTNASDFTYLPQHIVKNKAGAELGCFLACVPCALGQNPAPYYQLGESFGILLQVLSDYFDIWIQPHEQAISEDLLALKNSFPLSAARQDPEWGDLVNLALAGKHDSPKKQFALRRLLSQTQVIEQFDELLQVLKKDLARHFSVLPPLKHILYLSNTYVEQAEQLLKGLKRLKEITKPRAWESFTPPEQTVSMALAYLKFIPDFRDVWEVHRWGFLGEPILYGDIFNPLLILETLSQFEENIDTPLRRILSKKSRYGWHYYSNSLDIPPDTDDLGQLLQLVTHLPQTEYAPIMESALLSLANNIEDTGRCPTWLCDEERYPREVVNKTWYGDTCIAVMANLYYGLACYDPIHYAPQIKRGIDYILQQYDDAIPGWQGNHYKSHLYTLYLIARLLQKQTTPFDFSSAIHTLLQRQKLNGSWDQSPQETAFALLFLRTQTQTKVLETPIRKGKVFLMETQNHDGSWDGEDLFIRPGKNARFEYFNHPRVTTAFCLRAL